MLLLMVFNHWRLLALLVYKVLCSWILSYMLRAVSPTYLALLPSASHTLLVHWYTTPLSIIPLVNLYMPYKQWKSKGSIVSTGDHTRYKAMGHLNDHSRPQRLKPRDIKAKLKDSYQLISSSILPCCSTYSRICSYYQHLSSSTNLRPYSPHIHNIFDRLKLSLSWPLH